MKETRRLSEDWLALWLGLFVFALSLGVFGGVDVLGWAVKTNVWIHPGKALAPFSKAYDGLPGVVSLLATWAFTTALMGVAAWLLGANLRRFLLGFTVVFWIS